MTDACRPQSLAELRDAIAGSVEDGRVLEVVGSGSKRDLGRPIQAARQLDVSAIAGVRSYEPAELVLTVAAGTSLPEIETLLSAQNQMLAFEPPHFGALYGSSAFGTLGGVVACNLSGPRRIAKGAARDHFLGAVAVNGRGEVFKAGGKVVKNVTGYDLCKVMAGSFGTLAVLEEITVKVLPKPAKTRTVLLVGLNATEATAAMIGALNGPYELSGASYLPSQIAARSAVERVRRPGASVTALRIEGTAVSVDARTKAVCARLSHLAGIEELHTANSLQLWQEVRDVAALLPDRGRAVWRLSVPPSHGAEIASAIGGDHFLDWGGGLVWLAASEAGDGGAAAIRSRVDAVGGHATLIRAAPGLRAAVAVFHPQEAGLSKLTARIKEGFDPLRILNPGRMYADV